MRHPILHLLFVFLALLPAPAAAQVVATFYNREMGSEFPHAFFTLKGTTIADGRAVDANWGFTVKTLSPAILWGSVAGRLDIAKPGYIASSTAQFSVTLTDVQYHAVLAIVEKWRTKKAPSYNLDKANCIHFVGEAARAAGLTVTFPKALMRKPRSYLQELIRLNPQVTVIEP